MLSNSEIEEKVRNILEPYLETMGYVLVDIKYAREGKGWVLRVYVDREEGGITLNECREISEQLSAELDVEDFIPGAYLLEVSSPGVDRPLKTYSDFRRVKNRKVEVFFKEPLGKRRSIEGVVLAVYEDAVLLESEAGEVEIPFEKINFGKQRIDFGKPRSFRK